MKRGVTLRLYSLSLSQMQTLKSTAAQTVLHPSTHTSRHVSLLPDFKEYTIGLTRKERRWNSQKTVWQRLKKHIFFLNYGLILIRVIKCHRLLC